MKTLLLIIILLVTSTSFAKSKAQLKKKPVLFQEQPLQKTDETPVPLQEGPKQASRIEAYTLGAGNFSQYVGKLQVDAKGSTEKFNFNPIFLAGLRIKINDSFTFIPNAGMTFPLKGEDQHVTKWNFLFQADFGYRMESWLFKFGMGYALTSINPDGQNQTLPNGNEQSTFYTPDTAVTTYNITTNLGTEFFFTPQVSGNAMLYIYNLPDSTSRSVSYLLSLNYNIF